MVSTSHSKDQVKRWVNAIFDDEIQDITVHISEDSEKISSFLANILFVTVNGTPIFLKNSIGSLHLREQLPIRDTFLNEIFLYESVLPAFRRFEAKKGVKEPFNNVPKYYGKFTDENLEVFALEDLRKSGYDLWNAKLPMPKEYLRSVLHALAKFHAISIAMKDQEPEKFHQLVSNSSNLVKKFNTSDSSEFPRIFESNLDFACTAVQNDLERSVLEKWKGLKHQMRYIITELADNVPGIEVFTHADAWCNNFLFNSSSQAVGKIPKAMIIDWQMSWPTTPIVDISRFLFCSISKSDLENINDFLLEYHTALTVRLEELGSNAQLLYPLEEFLKDWKTYSKYGLLYTNIVMKINLSEDDEKPKLNDGRDQKSSLADLFSGMQNTKALKERLVPIIEYAFKNNLLD